MARAGRYSSGSGSAQVRGFLPPPSSLSFSHWRNSGGVLKDRRVSFETITHPALAEHPVFQWLAHSRLGRPLLSRALLTFKGVELLAAPPV